MLVPHHEQELDYSCLVACVRMVLAFHGSEHTEAKLRGLLKTRPGGTSPANVMFRLPDLGFDAYVQTGSQAILRENLATGYPCIVHVWTSPLPHWHEEVIHALRERWESMKRRRFSLYRNIAAEGIPLTPEPV